MRKVKALSLALLVATLLLGFFQLLYTYDNKYKHQQAPIIDGVLDLQTIHLFDHRIYSLVDNWHFYPHINTKDSLDAIPFETIYIGQYPDYAMRDDTQDPYGIAAYHLQLQTDKKGQSICLFIPEVDIAYTLWINKEVVLQNGDITKHPILPYIKYQVIEIDVVDTCDILFFVGNDSFYYSGLYFPILLSDTQGIQDVIIHKLLFYGFLCFTSFALLCYSLVLWLRSRHPLHLAFGIATYSFALFTFIEILRF